MKNRLGRVVVLGVVILGFWNGILNQDHLLIWGCGFFLVCLACCALHVAITVRTVRRAGSQTRHPNRIESQTGQERLTGWRLRFLRKVPTAQIRWTLNEQPTSWDRRRGVISERVEFDRRRLDLGLTRRFEVRDPLGFFVWRWVQEWPNQLRVLPEVDSSRALAPPIGVVAGSDLPDPSSAETGDRLDMRRYRKGDPLRLILWPIYQRSGHVMVRAPERAVSQHQRTGLYILNGPQDNSSAALARILLERDALGTGWRFGAEGSGLPWAHALEDSLDALAAGGSRELKTYDLQHFLEDLTRDRFGKCLILVSPDPENRNHKVTSLAHGERLPRIGIEIWVVAAHGELPHRNSFPRIAGVDMNLIARDNEAFKMVNW